MVMIAAGVVSILIGVVLFRFVHPQHASIPEVNASIVGNLLEFSIGVLAGWAAAERR